MLHAPNLELIPPMESLPGGIPFAGGKGFIVDIPVDPKGVTGVYIDDTVGLTMDIEVSNNTMRLERAILLDIYMVVCPRHPSEPIPCEETTALAKLLAKAKLEETKTILGWDFRSQKDVSSSSREQIHGLD